MKRFGNLYPQIISKKNLFLAFKKAKLRKRNKNKVFNFTLNLGVEIKALYQELKEGSYKPLPYREFILKEKKPRLISAPHFRDVVVQHAIYSVIYPLFERTFITQTHGCVKGRGTLSAANALQGFLKSSSVEKYYLQCDIRKYFYSIDTNILKMLLEQKIKDKRVIELLMLFTPKEVGMPLGNLLSQLFSNIYLNPLDSFIKRELKVKKYLRYVDDFILLDLTKEEARQCLNAIRGFLYTKLNLELSKYTLQKHRCGVNFVGFRVWKNLRLVRKRNLKAFKQSVKSKNFKAIISQIANAKYTNSNLKYKRILQEAGLFEELSANQQRILQ